jgi:basic membrane protein A and related proteins
MIFYPEKIGVVLLTGIDDQGWGTAAYSGLMEIARLGKYEIQWLDRVPLQKVDEAFNTLCREKCDLIFGHGGELSIAIKQAAEAYPDRKFACINGLFIARNLASLEMRDEELGYLAGSLAGKLSQTHKVGFVGGLRIPPTIRHATGFAAGARASGAKSLQTFTSDFTDPVMARSAAWKQIGQGVDILYCYLNDAWKGVFEACQHSNCRMIEPTIERITQAPEVILASAIQNVGKLYVKAAQLASQDKLEGQRYRFGLEEPEIERLVLHGVSTPIVEEMEEIRQEILSGAISIGQP